MTKKYLDLTALKPGDVLLTSEYTKVSSGLVFAQRILHFKLRGRGFSHATIVISPMLTFDTRQNSGARFRRLIATEISEDNQGRLQLWLDISQYKNIAVMRYGIPVESHALLKLAMNENTTPYPILSAFFSLIHPRIKSVWNMMTKRKPRSSGEHTQRFCSSLVAYLLQQSGGKYFKEKDWSAISPFKLHIFQYEQHHLILERTPKDFSTKPIHVALLRQAQAEAGANFFTDIDSFQHASEDIVRVIANGSLIKASLAHDPDYFIMIDGKKISLLDKPHYQQFPILTQQINSNSEMLSRLSSMNACFSHCAGACANAASCEKDMRLQMTKLIGADNAFFIN